METHRLPRQCYTLLIKLDKQSKTNWVTKKRMVLQSFGFNCVWLNQGVENEMKFLSVFRQRIVDVVNQDWFAGMRDSEHLNLYRSFKPVLTLEEYFSEVKVKVFRESLTRFRLGVSDIKTHRNRFSSNGNSDINHCPFCPQAVEDEKHILFHCNKYNNIRPKPFKISQYIMKTNI